MSSSARFFAVILFTLLCVSICLRAQSPTKPACKSPRGTVSGHVTIKDKPAPGVTIGMRRTGGFNLNEKSYKAVTDHDGFYRITDVPAGNYDIVPSAPAYVTGDANNPRAHKSVSVGENEDVEDINFSLVRGGVITGKVTGPDGRPLIQHEVNLYRATDFLQQPLRQVFTAAQVQTDDRGIYRFFGLAPGRYKVACGQGDELYAGTHSPSRVIYKQVFHPDVTDQAKATIIDVPEGSEATNVDIAVGPPVQAFTVSGRVIDAEKGAPVPNMRFGFQRSAGERFEMGPTTAITNTRGEFVAEGLMPGKYAVILYPNQDREMRAEAVWFDVVDQDVTGLTIRMMKSSTVSGVIVLEHEDKKVLARLSELQLSAYVSAPPGMPMVGQSTFAVIAADGTFRLGGLSPGRVNLWLAARTGPAPPKGFMITRVESNGVILPGGLEIKEGDQLEGVRVFVSYGTASVRGVVNIDNGPLPDGARMFVRLTKQGTPPTIVAHTSVDARGHFMLDGIAAGLYELSVNAAVPGRRLPGTAKREISIQEGIVTEVSLTLDMTSPPKP